MAWCSTGVRPFVHPEILLSYELSILFAGIFRRLVPFAQPNNLRLIRLNWREYPGSSPYSQEEVDTIHSGNQDKQAEFVKKIGRQLAAFLEYAVRNLDIPKLEVVDGRKRGGLAVLSWSMGNVWAMSFLGNAQTLSEETNILLGNYLRTFILFGIPFLFATLSRLLTLPPRRRCDNHLLRPLTPGRSLPPFLGHIHRARKA